MRLNIDPDLVKQLVSRQLPNKSRHLDEMTHEPSIWQCDTGQWLSWFDSCQLTILWMANIKEVDLPRHAWDTLPSFLPYPTHTIRRRVRTYVRSVSHVTTKRKEVDHILWVWGSVPHELRARGSPAIIMRTLGHKISSLHRTNRVRSRLLPSGCLNCKNLVGRVGVFPLFIYVFIYLFIYFRY